MQPVFHRRSCERRQRISADYTAVPPVYGEKAREVSIAGGDFRENFTNRSYLGKTNTAYNEADLDNILECRRAMGDKPVIVCATVNNPMVMHEFEAEADAIVAEFGVSRAAVLDVVFGGYNPTGRLPIQMPKDMDAVEEQSEDRALDMETYIDSEGHNYDYGYGMNYEGVLPAWKSKRITENLIGTGTACVSVPILETKDRIRRT